MLTITAVISKILVKIVETIGRNWWLSLITIFINTCYTYFSLLFTTIIHYTYCIGNVGIMWIRDAEVSMNLGIKKRKKRCLYHKFIVWTVNRNIYTVSQLIVIIPLINIPQSVSL